MFGFTRWTLLLAMVVVSGICAGITVGVGQSPVPKGHDPGLQDAIKKALDGKTPVAETGDAILDGLIDAVNDTGSILDGSVLDEELGKMDLADDSSAPNQFDSERAAVAESLLKASRRLERIGSSDKSRRELVAQMRSEAVRLLSE